MTDLILCATDVQADGNRTVDLAIAAAKALGAKLDLLYVIDDEDLSIPSGAGLEPALEECKEFCAEEEARYQEQLSAERKRCEEAGVEASAFVTHGRPWRRIVEVAKERGSTLIVMGSGAQPEDEEQSVRLGERIIGTTTDRVIRVTEWPVFVAAGQTDIPPNLQGTRWLVGTDFSPASDAALELAQRFADKVGGQLHVGNVVVPAGGEEKPDEQRHWRELLRDQSKKEAEEKLIAFVKERVPNAHPEQVVSAHSPGRALCHAARLVEADVLVIGSHGRSLLGRLLVGSSAERALRLSHIPVLMVPAAAQI